MRPVAAVPSNMLRLDILAMTLSSVACLNSGRNVLQTNGAVPGYDKPLNEFDGVVKKNADDEQYHQDGKEQAGIQIGVRLQQQVAKSLICAHPFGNDGTDDGKSNGDFHAREDVRQGRRQAKIEKGLQGRGAG